MVIQAAAGWRGWCSLSAECGDSGGCWLEGLGVARQLNAVIQATAGWRGWV